MPKGFSVVLVDGARSEVEAVQFKNSDGLKVEFMYSDEETIGINGVNCGELKVLIEAKQRYAANDLSTESRQKHAEDLEFLFKNNQIDLQS